MIWLFSPAWVQRASAVSSWLFTADHDLPSSLINDLVEDAENNIWIATEDGLSRYNGSTFVTYRHQTDKEHSLRHNLVRCLFVDSDGHLLVGTVEGVQMYRPETDDFSLVATSADGGIMPGNVTQISQDRNGNLRLCGNTTCNLVIVGNELVLEPNLLTHRVDMTQCMVEDNEGVTWICQQYKDIYRMTAEGVISRLEEQDHGVVAAYLCVGEDGQIYMAGERQGLYRFDTVEQRFVLISDPEEHFVAATLRNSGDGHLLIGTDGNGLLSYEFSTGELKPYFFDSYQLTPSSQKVHAVLVDRNRSMWLGLYQKGVLGLTPRLMAFGYIGPKSETKNSIGDKCVTSIARTADGKVWVSTDNGGIFCIDDEGNTIKQYAYSHEPHGVPQTVLSLYEDNQQRLWFGAFHRGLGILDRKTGRCDYCTIEGVSEPSNIYGFAEDHKNRLWAASMGM
ncbi:MAG: two-component regulator propeller domain-containing protein, partial [Bacteroidales bacterium]|nr:two-component regulator propeller domain-containing protein [Bacteroidales bacterium]